MPNDSAAGRSKEPAIPSGFLKLNEIKGDTETKWLWPGKIPIGHVTIVAGEAASGKSLLAAKIAAHASSGIGWGDAGETLSSGPLQTGSVLIAHANQHENLVLKRRLLAAGADASRVNVVNRDAFEPQGQASNGENDKQSSGVRPVYMLEGALMQIRGASLVVIDDLQGWLGHTRLKPGELAEAFKRLATMAARYRVALVVLWRLEKAGRAAQMRQLDALSAAAPVVWLLAADTYSAQTRLAVCAQNRLGAQAENLAFGVEANRLVWRQAVRQVSADDVLAARTADRPERRQAGQWLLELLSHGPITAKQLFGEARACGLAERTVRRAADELDLHPTRDGRRNLWVWGVRAEARRVSEGEPVVKAEGERQKAEIGCASERKVAPQADEQNVAVLSEVGSLADTGHERDNHGYPTKRGNLAGSAEVEAELQSDAPQNVAALPEVGSLANAGDGRDNHGYPTKRGNLADSAVVQAETPPDLDERICRDAASDPEEEKARAEWDAAIAAFGEDEGEGETKEQAAAAAERERRRERRERRIMERTLAICRGD
jgi:hypothetical protein